MDKGLIIYLLCVAGIIPLVLIASKWRKLVNPVINFFYELSIFSRKKDYLPPKISIEGLGIKRNLKIIEVLFLAEMPFRIILGALLQKAIEKGALQIVSIKPLRMEAEKILPDTLDRLEREFVRICVERTPKKRQEKLIHFLIRMIKTTSNQMRGFSLKETVQYHTASIDAVTEKAAVEKAQEIIEQLVEDMDELTKQVTKATNPFKDAPIFKEEPKYMRSYRGSGGSVGGGRLGGGGGCACAGCACACACAGCACACAGGGR